LPSEIISFGPEFSTEYPYIKNEKEKEWNALSFILAQCYTAIGLVIHIRRSKHPTCTVPKLNMHV
jgi:hypothetical protein